MGGPTDRDGSPGPEASEAHTLRQALSAGTFSSPTRAYGMVDTTTQHVGVDDSLSNTGLAELAFSLRGLRDSGIDFLTVPTAGTGMEGSQSVVRLDPNGGRELWAAVQDGTAHDWAALRPQARLSETPR